MQLKHLYEASMFDPNIQKELKRQGYKFLGAGLDQQAWLAKDGTIIKIFGTSNVKGGTLSKNHKMFIEWKKFCDTWKNKTHLVPHHIEYSTFMYGGKTYLQIRMERLFDLTPEIESFIESVVSFAEAANTKGAFLHVLEKKASDIYNEWNRRGSIATIGAIEDMGTFYDIIKALAKKADQNGWDLDLHSGNLMLDDEGRLVIIDPWHIGQWPSKSARSYY